MIFVIDIVLNLMEGNEMAPDNLKFDLYEQFKSESQASFYSKVDASFDAGVASVPGGGGISQEQLDEAVAKAKSDLKLAVLAVLPGVVDNVDADTQNDEVLKSALASAVEAL